MLQQLHLPGNSINCKHEEIPLKMFNLFNIANNDINSTFKLKRKLDWRLELISVMKKCNPGTISSFPKDTHMEWSCSRGYRNVRENQWGMQSCLATSSGDIREAHTILVYCFTDPTVLTPQSTSSALTRRSLPSFLSILAQFPQPKFLVTFNGI